MSLRQLALATVVVWGFVGVLFVASAVLPGPLREGGAPPGQPARRYRLNGFSLFLLVVAATAASVGAGLWSPAVIARHAGPLLVAANLLSAVVSVILYVAGRRRATGAAAGGLRQAVRDFVMGSERDPTWLGVDLKLFSYRPSLLGLGLLNLSFAFVQYERHGFVSTPLLIYEAFTLAYVANYFRFEHGMLFTWDLLQERFGWALVWGDYVLVPFFYSLPGWYLVDRVEPLSGPALAGLVGLYGLGFWLFRGANQQKHRFKVDPGAWIWGRPAESLGGRLLVSGFWGIGRKLNYTGELLMYLAWTLPCGFGSVIPYLPVLWLCVFFWHRARRDDRRCRAKYGPLWVAYCARARFRMIPFVY